MVQQCVSPKFNRVAIEPLLTRFCRSNFNVITSTFRRNTTEPLMRFVPLQHHQHASPFHSGRTSRTSPHETPHRLRVYLARNLSAFRVFTLVTVFSLHGFAGLFHPAGTHGVFPFRAFPSDAAVSPFGDLCPLVVSASRCRYVLRAFRAFIYVEIRWPPFCVSTETAASMLSWVSCPPGFSPVSPWYRLPGPSSPFSGPSHSEVNLNGAD